MFKALLVVLVIVAGLGVFIWSSDRITLEGERTIYTVECVQGAWESLRCSGRMVAGDRHRFRSSRSRREVVYWIAGSSASSGKYADCDVTDRDLWSCTAHDGDKPSIAHELVDGRPVQRHAGLDQPFHAVNKWKWWALRLGFPWISTADFSNNVNPRTHRSAPPAAPQPAPHK